MPRMTYDDAQEILYLCGLQSRPDFHTLSAATVESLLAHADAVKYRKPKNANGSRGRYFYAHLCRVAPFEAMRRRALIAARNGHAPRV